MTRQNENSTWPKQLAPLTAEQKTISDDFVKYWHELLPTRYGMVERFNHGYPVRHAPREFLTTLEVGAGLGEHLAYERLSLSQSCHYVALELRSNMAQRIQERYPDIRTHVGDCQERLEFSDGFFDRILAIHVLEHLPNLPAAVREMYRLCHKERGVLSVVIPCEGGWAYSLARRVSAQRIFEQRYGQSYAWFIQREHLNRPHEILRELGACFRVADRTYFPLHVPSVLLNLCIGMTLRPLPSVNYS